MRGGLRPASYRPRRPRGIPPRDDRDPGSRRGPAPLRRCLARPRLRRRRPPGRLLGTQPLPLGHRRRPDHGAGSGRHRERRRYPRRRAGDGPRRMRQRVRARRAGEDLAEGGVARRLRLTYSRHRPAGDPVFQRPRWIWTGRGVLDALLRGHDSVPYGFTGAGGPYASPSVFAAFSRSPPSTRCTETKNTGTISRARITTATMPPITTVPSDCWLAPPAPWAIAIGSTPQMKARPVIRIGRKRRRQASMVASTSGLPCCRRSLANSMIRIASLAARPMMVMRPTVK